MNDVTTEQLSKSLLKSKTFYVGLLEILIGIAGLVSSFFHVGDFTPEAITSLVAGCLTIILRLVTNKPISAVSKAKPSDSSPTP